MSKLSKISEEQSVIESSDSKTITRRNRRNEASSISEIYDSEEYSGRDDEMANETSRNSIQATASNKKGKVKTSQQNINKKDFKGKNLKSKAVRLMKKSPTSSDDEMSIDKDSSAGSKEKKPYLLENETIKNGIEKIDAYTEHFDNWDDEIDEET